MKSFTLFKAVRKTILVGMVRNDVRHSRNQIDHHIRQWKLLAAGGMFEVVWKLFENLKMLPLKMIDGQFKESLAVVNTRIYEPR